jgi:hypothetical protein
MNPGIAQKVLDFFHPKKQYISIFIKNLFNHKKAIYRLLYKKYFFFTKKFYKK